MREGWRDVRLEDICAFQSGLWKGKKPPYVRVSVIRNTNFTEGGTIDKRDIAVLDVEEKQFQKRRLQPGDIILEKSGGGPKQPVGRVVLFEEVDGDYSFSNFTSSIRVLNHGDVDPRFLHRVLHYYHSSGRTEALQRRSTGIRNLQLKEYKQLTVPLPPLPEQRRIVAILDEVIGGIDRAIANTEQNLANARELFESYLNRVFTEKGEGWAERSIDEIADVKGGKRVPKGYKLIDSPTPYPYISVANFNDDGGVDVDRVRFIDEAVYKQIHRYTISADDVYISIAGTIGKTGIVPVELDGANLTENACRLVIKSEVDKYYLYYFTRTASFLEQALANTRTTAQPKLALSRLKTIKLPVPSLEVQSFIVDKTRSLEEQTAGIHSRYTRKLAALAELKQSILRKAFSGELTAKPKPVRSPGTMPDPTASAERPHRFDPPAAKNPAENL